MIGRVSRAAIVLAALAVMLLALPLAGLVVRAPWSTLARDLGAHEVREALRLSLVCSLAATALCLLFGLPLAWVLARSEFPGRSVIRAVALLPILLPPPVGGVALLAAFGRRGFAGRWLDQVFGVTLPFTTAGAALAEAFVAMPFLVITAEAGFRSLDRRYEEAAATLGASPLTRFRRVTLPLAAPSIAAGAVLAWARAIGEFGATITFAGNLEGVTQTMPLAVYLALETRPGAAIAMSLVLVALALVVLLSLRERWLRVPR